MGVRFSAYLAFDDNTPANGSPFTNDPSVWSLREDYGLSLCGERRFYAALGYDHDRHFAPPLIPLRGIPDFVARTSEIYQLLDGEDYVGWLTATEVAAALRHAAITEDELTQPVRVLLNVLRYLCSVFGDPRVRLVFAFIP